MILLLPGLTSIQSFFTNLGALYVFGDLLCFAFAHLAILRLRVKEPDLPRPFKLGWNIKFRGKELPLTAIFGLVATLTIWIIVIITQPYSRWAGIVWMIIGLTIFYFYRKKRRLLITHTQK
jgi:APA family basic amino acid/polyamine antiporter